MKQDYQFTCSYCKRDFTTKFSRDTHVKSKMCQKANYKKCIVSGCSFTYFFRTVLIEHLKIAHGQELKPEQFLIFKSQSEFLKWKIEMEIDTLSYYSRQSGNKKGIFAYYYCQRDGPSQTHPSRSKTSTVRETGKRRTPNAKGRIKTGTICTSMLKVKTLEDESISVRFLPTHNHPIDVNDLKHQRLKSKANEYISFLEDSPTKIKDILRRDASCSGDSRIRETSYFSSNNFILVDALMERQKRLLSVSCKLDLDDATATWFLVNNLRTESDHPVLIYKPFGGECVCGPDSARKLPADTFILGLQTKEQRLMMEQCSKDVLVLDTSRDMSQYGEDVLLLNVIGVDEMNREYPLAHCVCNKMDENTLKHFFHAIKEKLVTNVNCVIANEELVLVSAAKRGFQQKDLKHILCFWQFKNTVQRQLQNKVPDEELREEMFKVICSLVEASTENEFETILEAFVNAYGEYDDTKSFVQYFNSQCVPKKRKWAKCLRKFPHTHVDAFHNLLDSCCLNREASNRIETLVNLLLYVEKDYHIRRKIDTVSEQKDKAQKLISLGHKRLVDIVDEQMTEVVANEHWRFDNGPASVACDSVNSEPSYDVHRCATSCPYPLTCSIRCDSPPCVGLCIHLYVCTCLAPSVALCEHIHKVHATNLTNFEEKHEDLHSRALSPSVTSSAEEQVQDLPYSEELENLFSRLRHRIFYETHDPKSVLPRAIQVLSQLYADCEPYTKHVSLTISNIQQTKKRSCPEKSACVVPPSKKKTIHSSSNLKEEGKMFQDGVSSDEELSAFITEVEYEEQQDHY